MNYSDLLNLVTNFKKGTIHTLTYSRELKTKKNVSDIMTKIETVQVAFGVDYDHKKDTIEKRQSGELPEENQGLAESDEWVIFPYIIKNKKTNEIKLRCNGINSSKHEVKYFRNGLEVKPEDIIADCYSKEVNLEIPEVKKTFNLGIDKVLNLI